MTIRSREWLRFFLEPIPNGEEEYMGGSFEHLLEVQDGSQSLQQSMFVFTEALCDPPFTLKSWNIFHIFPSCFRIFPPGFMAFDRPMQEDASMHLHLQFASSRIRMPEDACIFTDTVTIDKNHHRTNREHRHSNGFPRPLTTS